MTMRYMFMPLRRYFDFRGRSRRMEFWSFALFLFLVSLVFNLVFLAFFVGAVVDAARNYSADGFDRFGRLDSNNVEYGLQLSLPPEALLAAIGPIGIGMAIAYLIFWLLMFIPMLAVQIRRLHDSDRTGWWAILPTLLYLGGLGLLAVGFLDPQTGLMTATVSALLLMVAAVSGLIVLIFLFMEGTRGDNRFGPDPKGADVTRTFS
jgi:uncharacterized membrane protein YhaH (DUF805 family)